MANYQKTMKYSPKALIGLVLMVFGLSVALVAVGKVNEFKRSNAAMPLNVYPCSGSFNQTDCFIVQNSSKAPIRFAYLLDCYDNNYCEDKTAIMTLQPGKTVTLGLNAGCSKWQLDLNWSSPDTANAKGVWEWGAVVEKNPNAVCNCNYTELTIQPSLPLPVK